MYVARVESVAAIEHNGPTVESGDGSASDDGASDGGAQHAVWAASFVYHMHDSCAFFKRAVSVVKLDSIGFHENTLIHFIFASFCVVPEFGIQLDHKLLVWFQGISQVPRRPLPDCAHEQLSAILFKSVCSWCVAEFIASRCSGKVGIMENWQDAQDRALALYHKYVKQSIDSVAAVVRFCHCGIVKTLGKLQEYAMAANASATALAIQAVRASAKSKAEIAADVAGIKNEGSAQALKVAKLQLAQYRAGQSASRSV